MRNILLIIHQLGFVLGVGAVTFSDLLFIRSIRDPDFFLKVRKFFPQISKVIWLGFFLLLISGIFLFLPKAKSLSLLSTFQAKFLIVTVIFLNGLFLNLIVSPRLRKFKSIYELKAFKTPAIVSGVVSAVSWYSALFLGFFRDLQLNILEILLVYLLLIIGGSFLLHFVFDIFLSHAQESVGEREVK